MSAEHADLSMPAGGGDPSKDAAVVELPDLSARQAGSGGRNHQEFDPEAGDRFEAVAFNDWGPWHAVPPGARRTLCGRDSNRADRMYQVFEIGGPDRGTAQIQCEVCARCVERRVANERQTPGTRRG